MLFSCKDKDVVIAYQYGVTAVNTSSAKTTVTNYLRDAGCQILPKIFIAADTTSCDAQALDLWENSVGKITLEDIAALNLNDTTTFTYSCCRFSDPSKISSPIICIGTFDYPPINYEYSE
ncbi:hypothetical protein FACS1894178_7440 [Bacteroidia bacterium]|nr:hypothetical protein FACS1894178_7440 [Bacteroidia bacterium]